jgi:hypothetical protein
MFKNSGSELHVGTRRPMQISTLLDYSKARTSWEIGEEHRLNMVLDLQSLFEHYVRSCTHAPRILAHIRGRYCYWSAKTDDRRHLFVTHGGKGVQQPYLSSTRIH